MSTVTTTMSRLLLAHIVSSTEERDPMCEFGDYNYVPTSARSRNRRGPVTSVDGSSRSVVWFPVHGTALMLAVLQVIKYPSLCYLVQGRVIHHHQSIYFFSRLEKEANRALVLSGSLGDTISTLVSHDGRFRDTN